MTNNEEQKEYLIQASPELDAPIITAILKSKIFSGKIGLEEFKDKNGNEIAISSTTKLHDKAFEYYGKCLRVLNNRNIKTITMTASEFCKSVGFKNYRVGRDMPRVRDYLLNFNSVMIGEKKDGEYNFFNLMQKFSYNEDTESVSVEFSDDFVGLAKRLWNKNFDMEMYASMKTPTSRCLMRWLDGRTPNYGGVAEVKIRKSKLISQLEILKTGKNKSKEENRVLKAALDELHEINFLGSWKKLSSGVNRKDPMYIIHVLDKELRTPEEDAKAKYARENRGKGSNKNDFKTTDDFLKELRDDETDVSVEEALGELF